MKKPLEHYPYAKARVLQEGNDLAILSLGPIGVTATEVTQRLLEEGHSVAHIDLVFAKPLDEECLRHVLASTPRLLVIEEGCLSGGVGSAVLQLAMEVSYSGCIKTLGLPDEFIPHGTPAVDWTCMLSMRRQRAY